MKAITFCGTEHLQFETVPDPEIADGQDVIVQVQACAVCGSDLHVYHGRETGLDAHTVMGHEFCGTVVETGKSVTRWKKGDRVMSPFTSNCGSCYYCSIGLTCRCTHSRLFGWVENNNGLHGGQAEFVRVPLSDNTLVALPDDLDFETGVLLGDIIPTGFHCARRASELSSSRVRVSGVFGCGPVGLMAILGARHSHHEKVLAFDRVASRLEWAKRLGAIPIHLNDPDMRGRVLEETEGRGLDAALEVVGSGEALRLCYDLLRPGGVISAVGVCTEKALSISPVQAYDKNITYSTGRCPARHLMPELTALARNGVFDFKSLISHRMPLSEGVDAYARFAAREEGMMKVMLQP